MKKLMFLLVAGTMFVFTACNCCSSDAAATEEVVACADDCQKACCLGCKATEGEKSCDLLASGDHSCCAPAEETHDHGPEGHSH